MKIRTKCVNCDVHFQFVVNGDDWRAWKSGRPIQDSLPYLSAEERELLLTCRCLECFERDENDFSEFPEFSEQSEKFEKS